MRLDYTKGGLQFFFVTLASAERRAVFSHLVSEGGRPQPKTAEKLPLGDC